MPVKLHLYVSPTGHRDNKCKLAKAFIFQVEKLDSKDKDENEPDHDEIKQKDKENSEPDESNKIDETDEKGESEKPSSSSAK